MIKGLHQYIHMVKAYTSILYVGVMLLHFYAQVLKQFNWQKLFKSQKKMTKPHDIIDI